MNEIHSLQAGAAVLGEVAHGRVRELWTICQEDLPQAVAAVRGEAAHRRGV